MRTLLAAMFLLLAAGNALADVSRDPRDPPRPPPETSSEPSPAPEKSAGKACGVGAGMALFGIGVFGAWRLSKMRPVSKEVAA